MLKQPGPQIGNPSRHRHPESLRTIPRQEWASFCDSFSRIHESWLVTLTVDRPSEDAASPSRSMVIARQEPLRGLTAELGKDPLDDLTVILGPDLDQHHTHIIPSPTLIQVIETQRGFVKGLRIETANEGVTTLRFRVAARPELVDDIPGKHAKESGFETPIPRSKPAPR